MLTIRKKFLQHFTRGNAIRPDFRIILNAAGEMRLSLAIQQQEHKNFYQNDGLLVQLVLSRALALRS